MEQRPNEQELLAMLAGVDPGQQGIIPPEMSIPSGGRVLRAGGEGAMPGWGEVKERGPVPGDIPPEMQTPRAPQAAPERAMKRKPVNTKDEDETIERCYTLFEEFRSAYASEWERQDKNEKIYRCEHWEMMRRGGPDEDPGIEPVTPLVQSIVENIQADLMDGFPDAVIRPEDPRFNDVADIIGAVISQNHDAQNFREEYRRMVHDLLVNGWCVSETGYDSHAYSNIGMAFTRYVNIRNILFDPEVENVQDGRAVFKIQRVTVKRLEELYPEFEGQFEADIYELLGEHDPKIKKDDTKDLLLLEYWWREYDKKNECYRVHMAKCAGHKLLEDSRRVKPEGYYSDGSYPFDVTTDHRRKGGPLGLGIADAFGVTQMVTDLMDQIVVKNTIMASKNKMLVARSAGFDAEDLQDWDKEVHVGDQLNGVTWMPTPPLQAHILNYIQLMRQTARDESGANDFSRGNTASGVTAASAIAALQEASGKRSRMLKDQLHASYKEAVRKEIVFEREYNILPRHVLIVKNGEEQPMTFNAAMLSAESETGVDVPIEFMISVKVETQRQWQVQTHNELMLQLAQTGALDPMMLIGNMIFEGKESILKQIADKQKEQAEAAMAQQAMAAEQGGGGPSPEEQQAAEAQAQAEQAMAQLPDPSALANAGGQAQPSRVMGQ